MRSLPATTVTTYANLVQMHLNRPVFEISGAPFTRERNGKKYWYANQRIGSRGAPRQRYIGPDTEEMRARIEAMRADLQDQASFREAASGFVAQLRAAGAPTLDRQAGAILRSFCNAGVFRLGGTLVGTNAFIHYDLITGVALSQIGPKSKNITQTEDIDIASFTRLALAIDDETDPELPRALESLGFQPKNSLDPNKPTSWTRGDGAYAIDFITPAFSDDRSPTLQKSLHIWAQPLPYLDFLIKEPVAAVALYMEGLLVQVPSPERFAVHKLIVSQKRRRDSAKRYKDLAQARALIHALSEQTPHELYAALDEARARGPKWKEALDNALELDFAAPALRHDFNRDVIGFAGAALGDEQRCAISAEALCDHFDANTLQAEPLIDAARQNRSRIETIAKEKFRRRPSAETLVTSSDVAAFS